MCFLFVLFEQFSCTNVFICIIVFFLLNKSPFEIKHSCISTIKHLVKGCVYGWQFQQKTCYYCINVVLPYPFIGSNVLFINTLLSKVHSCLYLHNRFVHRVTLPPLSIILTNIYIQTISIRQYILNEHNYMSCLV